MADKKIIAVVGATGAQGGGLVARHPERPGRRLRRARDHPGRQAPTRRRNWRGWAPRSSRADVDDRRASKRAFAGPTAPTASRSSGRTSRPRRSWPRPGPWPRRRRHAGPQARHLVHARGHAQVGAAERQPHADADGQVQGAALRRQGRGQPVLHRPRRARHVPADLVLLGQLHLLRHGPEEGPGRQAGHHAAAWATRSSRASRPRTSASAPTASSRRAASTSARPSASPAST